MAWLAAFVVSMGYRALLKPGEKTGQVHGSGLGMKRYVVERAMAWLDNDRRLRVCYERTWQSRQGLHELAACLFRARRLRAVNQRSQNPPNQRF